jgi:hypothetical protein
MKLRGLVLFFFLCAFLSVTRAERWNLGWDLGGGGGVTSYTGDLNLSPYPRELGVNLGLLARFTFNKYYAARLNLFGGNVSGSYDPKRYMLPITNGKSVEAFNHFLIGFDANVEINFLPFIVNILAQRRYNNEFIAPYATFGIGALAASGGGMHVYTPMGAGLKIALGSRLTIAGELRFLKMYRDELDAYKNIPTNDGMWGIHNQDWIPMISLTCAYRIFFSIQRCAAYN